MEIIKKIDEIENDLANLARLAAKESPEDVRLLLARLVRKYRAVRPQLAAQLDMTLQTSRIRSSGPSILRRERFEADVSSMPVDADSKLSLIRIFDDLAGLAPPILPSGLMQQLGSITRERLERVRLEAHGIRPTRSAIFVGPPGVGKTLSARWIASQLGKPLWVLDLTTVMSSLLGKTANNLRAVFEHAKSQQAVLLLDEIDSIAKRRSDDSDVGELKRLVAAILQEVDAWPDSSLLLAATNYPDLIDPALWRRFDTVITFEQPASLVVHQAILRFLAADADVFMPWIDMLAALHQDRSLSDVERSVMALRRTMILNNTSAEKIVLDFAAGNSTVLAPSKRIELAVALARSGSMSHNKILNLTGVSRDTIRKYAGPSSIKGRGRKVVA